MSDSEKTIEAAPDQAGAGAGPEGAPPAGGRFSTPVFVGLIAGGLLLVAFAVAVLRKGDRPLLPQLTGGAQVPSLGQGAKGAPSAVSPIGTIPHGPLVLHWTKVPGIDNYQVFVYDNRIKVLWSSAKLQADSVEVPESARNLIVPGPTHFWRVVGYGKDGLEETSPTVQFVVAP